MRVWSNFHASPSHTQLSPSQSNVQVPMQASSSVRCESAPVTTLRSSTNNPALLLDEYSEVPSGLRVRSLISSWPVRSGVQPVSAAP